VKGERNSNVLEKRKSAILQLRVGGVRETQKEKALKAGNSISLFSQKAENGGHPELSRGGNRRKVNAKKTRSTQGGFVEKS